MKLIKLTRGREAIVDDKYYDIVSQMRWHFKPGRNGRGYAVTTINKRQIFLHVYIVILEFGAIPHGMEVDHIRTLDSLDNRVENLRLATQCQNAQNRGVSKNKKSCGYKGVYFRKDKKTKPWFSSIEADRKRYHLGFFWTAEEAAGAYNEASERLHGAFGYINPIDTGDQDDY